MHIKNNLTQVSEKVLRILLLFQYVYLRNIGILEGVLKSTLIKEKKYFIFSPISH